MGPITGARIGIIANRPAILEICFNAPEIAFNTPALSRIHPPTAAPSRPQKPGGSWNLMPAAALIALTHASTAALWSAWTWFAASVVACNAALAASNWPDAAAVGVW